MRFAVAHKASSYLMAGCAFMALVFSGELPFIAVIVSAIAFAGSWFWEPPRVNPQKYTAAWTVVSVVMFVYAAISALTGSDLLVAGSTFILYLQITKLCNRNASRDYQQIYILSFLMMVAGTVLNSQVNYGVFFIGFVVSSTWALTLFHLRREMEDNLLLKHANGRASERVQVTRVLNSRRIVGRRFFVGSSMVSVGVFFAAMAFFLFIPRIGFGLFFDKARSPVHMAGFSDGVRLGGHGLIKKDSRVVMRATIDTEYAGRKAPYIYWRGVAFDRYENGQWRRTRLSPQTRREVVRRPGGDVVHFILYGDEKPTPAALNQRLNDSTRQEIYLEPTGYDVMFGASMPVAFEFQSITRKLRAGHNDEMRVSHQSGIKYTVHSVLDKPSPQDLRAATEKLPAGFDIYLDIPPDIPPRVVELARTITAGKTTPYDKAVALEAWLKKNLGYTLKLESPGAQEPIDFFLFDRKVGHCEYFSSAMAIMLRAVNVPSRNVNGFLGGEWNEYNDYIAVRAGDAHSWVEAYFPGYGWVTFDATPSGQVDILGRGGSGFADRMRRLADTMRFKWFKWVIEYDLLRQISMFRNFTRRIRAGASAVTSGNKGSFKALLKRHKSTALWFIAAVVGVAFGVTWLQRKRHGPPGAPRAGRRKASKVRKIYTAAVARFTKLGHPRAPSMTPREYASSVSAKSAPGAGAFTELTELYYELEYAPWAGGDGLERATSLLQDIESAVRAAR